MAEVSHDDILQRVEHTEREVAVLNYQFQDMKTEQRAQGEGIKENGRLAREVKTQINMLGKTMIFMVSALSVMILILRFVVDKI